MDLRKRLASLDRLSQKKNKSAVSEDKGQSVDSATLEKSLKKLKLKRSVSADDSVWIRQYLDEVTFPWGELPPLEGFFTRAGEAFPELEEILFLDTETTGLSGGTGTLAFLVGVGWFRNTTFHSRQYFLPDFSHEYSMLAELSTMARDFKVVMTFNGASFDLPLLRTRALMNRLKDPCGHLVSWDLLVPGRRLWSRIFPNCRQQTLEKGLLDIRRGSGDIDGALIPQTWFDFLKTGDGAMIGRVLHHNQRDLLGMVGILGDVLDRARRLLDGNATVDSWREAWALGRIAEKARHQESAAFWMHRACIMSESSGDNGYLQARFVADTIRILKRQANWQRIAHAIDKSLKAGLDEPWLHREAAILYEHRITNLSLALAHAHVCHEPGRVRRLEMKILKKTEVKHG